MDDDHPINLAKTKILRANGAMELVIKEALTEDARFDRDSGYELDRHLK